jgi:hypothetical protein
MAFKLTQKSKDLVRTKIIDGELYALCDWDDTKELWLKVTPVETLKCARCGYSGPALDQHHIHGRKNSGETITLCANCHREYHLEHGYYMRGKK